MVPGGEHDAGERECVGAERGGGGVEQDPAQLERYALGELLGHRDTSWSDSRAAAYATGSVATGTRTDMRTSIADYTSAWA